MAVMRMPASPPAKKIKDKEHRTAISGEYNLKEKGSQASAFLPTIIPTNNYSYQQLSTIMDWECSVPHHPSVKCSRWKFSAKSVKRKETREARIMGWHK